jgi:hypothetical protein
MIGVYTHRISKKETDRLALMAYSLPIWLSGDRLAAEDLAADRDAAPRRG